MLLKAHQFIFGLDGAEDGSFVFDLFFKWVKKLSWWLKVKDNKR